MRTEEEIRARLEFVLDANVRDSEIWQTEIDILKWVLDKGDK